MKAKYKIGDIVMWGERSIFCEFFPITSKICSGRKLGLLGYYYYTRVRVWMPDGIHEYRTKRIYERNIEMKIEGMEELS